MTARTFDPQQLASIDFSAFPQTQEFPAMQFYPKEWITGEATRAMGPNQRGAFIDLLAEAWDQKPPCSLPDDDSVLANLSHLGRDIWKKHGALVRKQFVKCKDGRLRNPKQIAVWIGMMSIRLKRRGSRNKSLGVVSTNEDGLLSSAIAAATAEAEATKEPGIRTEIPADFAPSEKDRLWARTVVGLSDAEIDRRTTRFIRHNRAQGKKFVRHNDAWRNWIEERFVDERKHGGNGSGRTEQPKQRFKQRTAAEVLAKIKNA